MKAKAAVFLGVGKPFEIQEFPLPKVEPGAILAKVLMSTICGSDLHTWQGKRSAPLPIILGHEIIGRIEKIGKGTRTDVMGNSLLKGDRITWTIMASCGMCYYCAMKHLPQKCLNLFKYGHTSCQKSPYLNGGMAEYVYIRPGTGVFKIPDTLSDEEVVPINCALATVVNGLETIGVKSGDNIVVQGAGMLGLNTVALLKEKGVEKIISIDRDAYRLNFAKEFGADYTINSKNKKASDTIKEIKNLTNGYGADIIIEVCGVPSVIPEGIQMLRIGGRYLIIGTVFPEANFNLDGYLITTKMLTIKGIHNYNICHLGEAMNFLVKNHNKYPFKKLVAHKFHLKEANRAFEMSAAHEAIRIAVIP